MSILSPYPGQDIATVVKMSARLMPKWQSWFVNLFNLVSPIGDNGTTANRPTANLFVGRMYFDTTLGYPVWVKVLGSPATWCKWDGTTV